MRTPLNQIEQIERYLSGEMTGAELIEFERKINDDPALKEQVETQRLVEQSVRRKALRSEIEAVAATPASSPFTFPRILGAIAVLALLGVGLFFAFGTASSDTPPIAELQDSVIVEEPENAFLHGIGGLKTWVDPDVQEFTIKGSTGGTIEGKDGMLIIVPSGAFLDKSGNAIDGDVNVELVEALHLEEMVLYNLTTTADGAPLESGGMFYLNATQNGDSVIINPERPLYIEVPTNEVKPGMMAFSGEADENGDLNWKDPQPLKKYLTNVDLELLDFLPDGFEEGVQGGMPFRNHREADDALVDSLYYSLSPGADQNTSANTPSVIETSSDAKVSTQNNNPSGNNQNVVNATLSSNNSSTNTSTPKPKKRKKQKQVDCGIDPLSIRTIRTGQFQNTFIATSEFETRVQVLHDIKKGQKLFDIYINNLGKDMYVIDSMVMTRLSGSKKKKFEAFYNQKCTNIKDAEIYQEQLSAYYNKKKQEFADELATVKAEFEQMKSAELNALYKELRDVAKEYQKTGNVTQSVALTNRVQKMQISMRSSVATSPAYGIRWASTGWANIDCYLHMLHNDPKQVAIIAQVDKTDDTKMYQWLNAINTLTPLYVSNQSANALFPKEGTPEGDRMRNTYTFAISEDENGYKWGMQAYNPYSTESVEMSMKPTGIAKIRENLNALGGHSSNVMKHIQRLKDQAKKQKEIRSAQRKLRKDRKAKEAYITNKIQALNARRYEEMLFIRKLTEIAFPCPLPALGTGCFVEGTSISLTNGEEKPIHLMKIGEEIMAFDTVQNKIITAMVTKLHKHEERIYAVRSITLNDGKNTMVTCTDEHPFWTDNNEWINADKLNEGDVLYILDEKSGELKPFAIAKIQVGKVVQTVYNISTTAKNYYANGILVHNK